MNSTQHGKSKLVYDSTDLKIYRVESISIGVKSSYFFNHATSFYQYFTKLQLETILPYMDNMEKPVIQL